MDGFNWNTAQTIAGLRFKTTGGAEIKGGTLTVDDHKAGELTVRWPTHEPKGEMIDTFNAPPANLDAVGAIKQDWHLELSNSGEAVLSFPEVTPKMLSYQFKKAPTPYQRI